LPHLGRCLVRPTLQGYITPPLPRTAARWFTAYYLPVPPLPRLPHYLTATCFLRPTPLLVGCGLDTLDFTTHTRSSRCPFPWPSCPLHCRFTFPPHTTGERPPGADAHHHHFAFARTPGLHTPTLHPFTAFTLRTHFTRRVAFSACCSRPYLFTPPPPGSAAHPTPPSIPLTHAFITPYLRTWVNERTFVRVCAMPPGHHQNYPHEQLPPALTLLPCRVGWTAGI